MLHDSNLHPVKPLLNDLRVFTLGMLMIIFLREAGSKAGHGIK